MKLVAENAVVTAAPFNPGTITEPMLNRIGVASEDEIRTRIFTPQFVQVATSRFDIVALPDRLQFATVMDHLDAAEISIEPLVRIVKALPFTPYMAFGFNLNWISDAMSDSLASTTRRLLLPSNSVLSHDFEAATCRFGGYFSKDVFGSQLRLSVLPFRYSAGDKASDVMQAAFSFSLDLNPESAVNQIVELAGKWSAAKKYSQAIADRIGAAL